MANINAYNEKRLKDKIKQYNWILSILVEPLSIRDLITYHGKRQSFYWRKVKDMVKEGFIIEAGEGALGCQLYQAIRFDYGVMDIEQLKQNQIIARRAWKAKQDAMNNVLPCGRIIRLEDYADRYAATQKMRTKPKIDARIGSTFSTMTF